jgi:hypothetical protein
MGSTDNIELRDAYSKELGAFAHFKIENSNLVITLDYDDGQFAAWTYLKMVDPNYKETLDNMVNTDGKIMDHVVDKYEVNYVDPSDASY